MDIKAIGAASIEMSMAKLQQSVDVSMVKKAMDQQESAAAMLIENLNAMQPVSYGHQIDVRI